MSAIYKLALSVSIIIPIGVLNLEDKRDPLNKGLAEGVVNPANVETVFPEIRRIELLNVSAT